MKKNWLVEERNMGQRMDVNWERTHPQMLCLLLGRDICAGLGKGQSVGT